MRAFFLSALTYQMTPDDKLNLWLDKLFDALELFFTEQPQSCSEQALIKILQQPPYQIIPQFDSNDAHQLFQIHFALYHALYRLRHKLLKNKKAQLTMGLAKIDYQIYTQAPSGVVLKDPLEEYYLDVTHLTSTSQADVESLLEGFWRKYQQYSKTELYQAACRELGVEINASYQQKKSAYKAQCLLHHPDKGGSLQKIQQLNEAWQIIKS
ncbi:DNA-J related domain-containing protein [Catenovulum sediminis]|uniref:DNA-J related domain-containing protein n=1 Tax=Catenovulum sediminis TaxID=1740262 RepID=UPI00117C0B62|nr:DNA-J related domain-containing protein [Catenovulum sediminis]